MSLTKQYIDSQLLAHTISNDRLTHLVQQADVKLFFPELMNIIGFGDGVHHKDLWAHTRQVVAQTTLTLSQRWTALLHDIGKPICFRIINREVTFHGHEACGADMFRVIAKRTHLWDDEQDQAEEIEWLIRNSGRVECVDEWSDSGVRRLITECGPRLPALLRFVRADVTTGRREKFLQHQRRIDDLESYIEKIKKADADRNVLPKGLGLVISEKFGIAPGPALGKAISSLKERVLSGELERNRDVDYYIAVL
jgi:hypothetical protein